MIKIYGLVCPLSGEIRYIGKTSQTLKRRLNAHVSEAKRFSHSHKHRWIAKCFSFGKLPSILLLEEIEEINNWQLRERKWIKLAQELGFDLVNQTEGGEGLCYINEEDSKPWRSKLSAASKAAFQNKPYLKENLRISCEKSWQLNREERINAIKSAWTQEAKTKLAATMDEVRKSESFKIAKSNGQKRVWQENREKLMNAFSRPEVKNKQAESKKKSWSDPDTRSRFMNRWTEDARAKQAAEILSRKEKIQAAMTPEVRAKQAASLKETWAKKKAKATMSTIESQG